MMGVYQINLSGEPQDFSVTLGGDVFRLSLRYRDAEGGGWFLDMERSRDGEKLLGMPLRLGVDLLKQYEHLGFGHLICVASPGRKAAGDLAYDELASQAKLLWSADYE